MSPPNGSPARVTGRGGAIAAFQPQEALANDAQADAVIAYAQKVRDWPMLEQAIEAKMDDQVEFVRWWSEAIRRKGGEHGHQ